LGSDQVIAIPITTDLTLFKQLTARYCLVKLAEFRLIFVVRYCIVAVLNVLYTL